MRSIHVLPAILVCGVALAPIVAAQRPTTKGMWEPVNYAEDLTLTDVFFVTPEIGWVTGAAGTILHTRDGGATWSAQLGGDPASTEPAIGHLHFLDERHGWATQGNTLLRTTDGETWQKIGAFGYEWGDYLFITPDVGIYVRHEQIHRSTDGGRTWKPVFTCRQRVTVGGLARDASCTVIRVHFPSPAVGYAVSSYVGEKGQFVLMQTSDGGETWSTSVVRDVPVQYGNEVFFLDEQRGLVAMDGQVHVTTDGGATWTGVVGSVGPSFRFADPEVGWSITRPNLGKQYLAFTIDGGRRWSSRELAFPAEVRGFTLPRRDRGYVVGDHGMIYRYRVIPGAQAAARGALPAPAVPVVDAALDDAVGAMDDQVEALEQEIAAAPPQDSGTVFVDACCARTVTELQATVDAAAPLIPRFLAKYRNVNLIVAGLQLLGVLPDHLSQVQAALQRLRQARGSAAAATSLTELEAAADALRAATRQAFQQDPLQLDSVGTGAPANGAEPAAQPDSASAAGQAEEAQRRARNDVRRRAEAAKRRIRVRLP